VKVKEMIKMGQYYLIVNLDKKEIIDPHKFGDGAKLLEFGNSSSGTMCGLAILLADGNNRGGGDLHSDNPIIGSWSGNRVVITGDYADTGKFLIDDRGRNLYDYADENYRDISFEVVDALMEDKWIKEDLEKNEFYKDMRKRYEKKVSVNTD
jgi:hypothetical protein